MRRLFAAALAAVALGGVAAAPTATGTPVAAIAKTCGHGYTHAVIGGQQKCLRRGEFCSYKERNQYHRYGFNCVLLRPSNTYHLEPRG
jgi:hypothetical protein